MTKFHGVALIAALSVVAISTSAKLLSQEPTAKFSLVISGPSSVPADSPFRIEIRITNVSKNGLDLAAGYRGNLPDGYRYLVRDQKGDVVSENPLCIRPMKIPHGGLRPPCQAPGSSIIGSLRPGDTWDTSAQLTDLYWFTRPGTYTIQVSRPEAEMPVVYSNVLTLEVLAKY
jgi:hypothetical protein